MVARDPRWLAVGETPPPGLLGRRERVDGIDVVWLRIPYEQRFTTRKRLLSYGAYALAASAAALRLGRPDVVYASSIPLTSGVPGAFAARLRGVPFVFELQDLWPEIPAALGYLTRRREITLAEWLEAALYARSDRLVVCSEAVVTALAGRGIPREKLVLIPNFSDRALPARQARRRVPSETWARPEVRRRLCGGAGSFERHLPTRGRSGRPEAGRRRGGAHRRGRRGDRTGRPRAARP
jgi:hypothetical protein